MRRTNFFGSLFKSILKIIAIILIIIAIVYGFYALLMYMEVITVAALPSLLVQGAAIIGITTLTWGALATIAILALAIAAIVDIDTTKDVIGKISDAVGSAVGGVVDTVTDVGSSVVGGAGKILSSAFSSVGGIVMVLSGAYVGWKLLNKPSAPVKQRTADSHGIDGRANMTRKDGNVSVEE